MANKFYNPDEKKKLNYVSLAAGILHLLALFMGNFVGGFSLFKIKNAMNKIADFSTSYEARKALEVMAGLFVFSIVYSTVVFLISSYKPLKIFRFVAIIASVLNVLFWGSIASELSEYSSKVLGLGYFLLVIATILGIISKKFDIKYVDSAVGMINAKTGEWRCPVCDGKNPAGSHRCSKCGTDRK